MQQGEDLAITQKAFDSVLWCKCSNALCLQKLYARKTTGVQYRTQTGVQQSLIFKRGNGGLSRNQIHVYCMLWEKQSLLNFSVIQTLQPLGHEQ